MAKSLLEAADQFQPLDRKFMIYTPRSKSTTPSKISRSKTAADSPGDSPARGGR
jgi:hypothetical protein